MSIYIYSLRNSVVIFTIKFSLSLSPSLFSYFHIIKSSILIYWRSRGTCCTYRSACRAPRFGICRVIGHIYLHSSNQRLVFVPGYGRVSNCKINANKSSRACRAELKPSIKIAVKSIRVDMLGPRANNGATGKGGKCDPLVSWL